MEKKKNKQTEWKWRNQKEIRNKPHDVDTKVRSELNEKLLHLTQVSSVAVGVEKRESGKRVSPEGGYNLVSALSIKQMNIHVLVGREPGEHQPPLFLSDHIVRWWVWWKKREFRSHIRRNIAH